jgi:uncharacterized protein (DUF58 family)
MPNPLLPTDLLRRLEQFQLLAQRRSKSNMRGERQSRARGHSVEFADYRDYVPGDDLRYLDWNLYGRLDRLFIKLYEEERELPVTILLDASESMTFGTPAKFDFARQVACAIGYVALCGFDQVSLKAFPDRPEEAAIRGALKQVRGRKSALRFFDQISQIGAQGSANLNEALKRAAIEAGRVGAAVVLSDFLDPAGYEPGLTALAGRGFEISVVQVLSPEELEPSTFGDLRFIDSETGAQQEVTFGRFRLQAYQKAVRGYCQRLHEFCQARGMHYFLASSNAPLEELLLKQLRQARIWG